MTCCWMWLPLFAVLCGTTEPEERASSLEHKIIHPLTYPIILSREPVQGLHLALKGHSKMRAIWLTPYSFQNRTFKPVCYFRSQESEGKAAAFGKAYTYTGGKFEWTLNMADMDLTKVENLYGPVYYMCGDRNYGWSQVHTFTVQRPEIPKCCPINEVNALPQLRKLEHPSVQRMEQNAVLNTPTKRRRLIGIIGDLGVTNCEETIESVLNFTTTSEMKLLIHIGDISYADNFGKLDGNNSYIWMEYMNKIQNVVTKIPYMVIPGNHEVQFGFSAYLNWLKMPYHESGSDSPFWYSYDYMGVHFLSFSTEHGFHPNSSQHQWMEKDLVRANNNRAKVPWVIVLGHRPLYCSSVIAAQQCIEEAAVFRSHLEEMLFLQNVDVYLSGHVHHYERSYPVYKNQVTKMNYYNPGAPVHLINGAGGNPEPNDATFMKNVKWRAFFVKGTDTGFLIMEAKPKSLHFQYLKSLNSKVVDNFTIYKY